MATSLITEIPIFVFSSQIGDIELSTDQAKIEIVVEDGLTKMFKTMLYAYNGKVTLVNIGEVLENYMGANGKVFTAFTVYYNTAEGAYIGSFNINTLYCSLVLDIEAGIFGSYNFLTTLKAKRIPRGATETLWLFHGQERGTAIAHCIYEDDNGDIANISVPFITLAFSDIGVSRIVITYAKLINQITSAGGKVRRLLSFSMEFNNRHITYYIVDAQANVSFHFNNCFNVSESIHFYAITSTKTKVNRSTALVGGRYLFYDQSVDKTYEVVSASLTDEEAHWVEQLLSSDDVRLGNSANVQNLPEVIITDSTCEMSDTDDELNKVKFTWQFAMKTPHLLKSFRSDTNGIFTEPYNQTFN